MFVSVGHSPRPELIDCVLENLDLPIEALEVGALDGLSSAQIDRLRQQAGEPGIVTCLRDGCAIVLSKPRIAERMTKIVASFQAKAYDLVVILTTGLNCDFESSCPIVNTQQAMESAVMSLAAHGDAVGIVQPLADQAFQLDLPALSLFRIAVSHAMEGDREALARALLDLADSDIIVLNSVGFTEANRQTIARASGKPVVLVRRLVAGAIRLLLNKSNLPARIDPSADFTKKLARLTPRQKQVLALVCDGLPNKLIARQLSISPKTVEIHRANVMNKMEVGSVGVLIRQAVSAGYV